LVQIINNIEQKMIGRRLARRGYDEGKYKYILDNKSLIGDVIVLRKRGFGQNSLRDFVGVNYC
jgi:hypothetical protein